MRIRANLLVLFLVSSLTLSAQSSTRVDIRNQSRNGSFVPVGTSLPTICLPGDLYLLKPVGSPGLLMVCSQSHTWTVQGLPELQVGTRILSSDGAVADWKTVGGDVTGPVNASSVVAIRNRPVSGAQPNTGQALIWDGTIWKPEFPGAPGQSSITVKSGAFTVPTSVLNFVAGAGLLVNVMDTGSETRVQPVLDTAVVVTNARLQSNQTLLCDAPSGGADDYTCALNPVLNTYDTGMLLYWRPQVTPAGSAVTLAVNSLAAKTVKLSDGQSDPVAGDIVAGRLYPLWFDGTVFRLPALPLPVFPAIGSTAARPSCALELRGRLWQKFGAAGVKDEAAVCAKGADNAYAWRIFY